MFRMVDGACPKRFHVKTLLQQQGTEWPHWASRVIHFLQVCGWPTTGESVGMSHVQGRAHLKLLIHLYPAPHYPLVQSLPAHWWGALVTGILSVPKINKKGCVYRYIYMLREYKNNLNKIAKRSKEFIRYVKGEMAAACKNRVAAHIMTSLLGSQVPS